MRFANLIGLTAALMLSLGTLPGTAYAGGKFGHIGFSGHFGGHGGHGYHPRHRTHAGVGVHSRHGFGHRGGHHRSRGHHGGRGAGYALLGFGAGLLTYHSLDRAHDRNRAYTSGDRLYRRAEPPRYAPRPAGQAAAPGAAIATSCLQTREYTTTVTIDGREVDAYGTACLQPDGSWVMGAPQMVPDSN